MKNRLFSLLILLLILCLVSCSNIKDKNLSDLNYIVKAKEDDIYLSFFDGTGKELKDIKFSAHKKGIFLPDVTEGPPALIVQDGKDSLKIYLSVFNEDRYETYTYNHSKQKVEKMNNIIDSNWNLYLGEKYIYNTVSKGQNTFLQKTTYKNHKVDEIDLPYNNPEKIVSNDKQDTQYVMFNEENKSILVKFKDGKKVKELDFGKQYIGDVEIYNKNIYVAKTKERKDKEDSTPLKEIEIFNADLNKVSTIETKGSPNMIKVKQGIVYVISDGDETLLEEYDTNSLKSMNTIKLGSGSSSIWDILVRDKNKVIVVKNNSLLYVDRGRKKSIDIDGDTKSITLSQPNG
ncbi:hypothetical protein BEH_26415 (plasmid) [Priestia filamentosa]|uniref:Uncharacterized protein n=1 Tax=Priestia filamentosa TaxID=1402861 RepID=A0A2S1LZS7_9BACI|nr:hypothetical protein [Priestia filamentosa]AWG44322.1 hypothetical protein BEH_26415 [Priestia filamentosa]